MNTYSFMQGHTAFPDNNEIIRVRWVACYFAITYQSHYSHYHFTIFYRTRVRSLATLVTN